MSDIIDLEQDIEALNKEIDSLIEKKQILRDKVQQKNVAQLANHPLVKDFQSLFDSFPQLFDTLSKKVSEEDKGYLDSGQISPRSPINKQSLQSREVSDRRSANPDSQHIFKQKAFDDSISSIIDTDILVSPSKRRSRLRKGTADSSLMRKIQCENTYRLFGITYFPVVDPTDLKKQENANEMTVIREMLGVRLEIFNGKRCKFEPPHYILLKKNPKSLSWALFKHTVPVYIDLQNSFDNSNAGPITTYQDVYLFAKDIYIQLAMASKRGQQLEELEEEGLIEGLQLDLQAAAVSFLINGFKAKLFLKDDQVVSCFVNDHQNTGGKTIEQILLGPMQELKQKIRHITC